MKERNRERFFSSEFLPAYIPLPPPRPYAIYRSNIQSRCPSDQTWSKSCLDCVLADAGDVALEYFDSSRRIRVLPQFRETNIAVPLLCVPWSTQTRGKPAIGYGRFDARRWGKWPSDSTQGCIQWFAGATHLSKGRFDADAARGRTSFGCTDRCN